MPRSTAAQPQAGPSASRTGTNFACASASSASGTESATMPQPANSRTVVPATSARAQRDAPLAVAGGVHPADRAGVPAPAHALDLVDQRDRGRGGRAADGRRGVQRLGQLQRRGRQLRVLRGMHDAGHVGGQVHHVGQVQHERRLGDVHARAVRLQRLGDRADGVLVLLEVLGRPGQRGGQRQVALVVAGAADGTGQHPRGDQAALAAHQHLGRRAEHAVDVERPAHRVRRGQALQRPADVDVGSSAVATRSRASTTFSRSPAPMRATASATTDIHCSLLRAPSAKLTMGRGRHGGGAERVGDLADGGQPGPVAPTADDDPRQHQHGVAGLVGEGERAEADRTGAGLGDLIRHVGAGDRLRPPLRGVGEAGRAGGADHGSDTPADQSLVPAEPGDGGVDGQQVHQLPGWEVQRHRPGDERLVGGCGGGHESEAYAAASRPAETGRQLQ